jgi:hypothetical protein
VLYNESFYSTEIPNKAWSDDTHPDDGPFSDKGVYFTKQGLIPPQAYRATAAFSSKGWLTLEAYSRSKNTPLSDLATIVTDPGNPKNKVLRLRSPAHTDAIVVRPTTPLPERYRVSVRVGYADFGDGNQGKNGYDGGERAEPWLDADATSENGFYWLAILDARPRPHNNVWIHHHRKIVIDSDNHHPPWMEIYNGNSFIWSGSYPVMLFALDGKGKGGEKTGKPFFSWAAGAWQASDKVRAVDAYLPKTWYSVHIERNKDQFTITISGHFKYGAQQTYSATIDAAKRCVWHYNQKPLSANSPCIDNTSYPSSTEALWPATKAWPDYFMFGDPHSNYYEGQVYYDDVTLELPIE